MSSSNSLARRGTRSARGSSTEVEESSESNESTPDKELERAKQLEKRGNSIRSGGSTGSSRPKSINLPMQGMVTPGAKDDGVRLLSTDQDTTSVSDISCLQEHLGSKKKNGARTDTYWMACQKAKKQAVKSNRDIKAFVREHVFAKMKFISGPTCMEMGELPSRMVLTFLNCEGSREDKTEIWNNVKKLVSEGVNQRRAICATLMKREFMSK